MGSCLCKGRQELQSGHQLCMGELQRCTEGQPTGQGSHQSRNGTMPEKASNSGYDIGELATSSLLGLVATIKEHITKPTAMAQGRVAHLIEWKGWGSETGGAGGWCSWSKEGGVGAILQEHEQLYSHMTDELKEARFAAGVAEQFALAEAAMNIWSSHDVSDQLTTTSVPVQDAEGLYLSHFLLDGGSMGVPHHLYSTHTNRDPPQAPLSCSPSSPSQQDSQRPPQDRRTTPTDAPVRHADSSSLSEDEVFYN